MSNDWGLWFDTAEEIGWFGFATSKEFRPMLFNEQEARERAAKSGMEARVVPESERVLPWNETEWNKRFRRVP